MTALMAPVSIKNLIHATSLLAPQQAEVIRS